MVGAEDGTHTYGARASDAAGNTSPESALTVVVDTTPQVDPPPPADTTPPAAPVTTAPANGSTDRDGSFNVRGTGEPGSIVRLYENGTLVGTSETDPGSGAWTVPVVDAEDGTAYLPRPRDGCGRERLSRVHPLTVVVDTTPPVEPPPPADTTAPAAPVTTGRRTASTDRDGSFNVRGTAEPGSIVRLFENGTRVGTSETDPGSGAWTIAVVDADDGTHTYRARATDAAGNASPDSAPISITVDGIAPELEAVRPAPGSTAGREALVTARFSEPIDWAAIAVPGRAFTLTKRGAAKPVRATVSYEAGTRTAILDPERKLRRGAVYDVVLGTSIRDLAGNRPAETTGWSFRVKKAAKR